MNDVDHMQILLALGLLAATLFFLDALEHVVHKHKDGPLYLKLWSVPSSTNADKGARLIIYFSLGKFLLHVRTEKEFTERVLWKDGYVRPRFLALYKFHDEKWPTSGSH